MWASTLSLQYSRNDIISWTVPISNSYHITCDVPNIVYRDPSVHSKHLNFYGSWTMNNGVDFSQRKGHKYCKAGRRQSEVLRRGGSNRKYKYKYKYKNTKKYKNTNSKRYGDDRWGGGSNHWQLRPIHRGGIPTLLPSIPTLLPQQFFILNFNHVYDALHRHVETSLSVVLIRTQYQLCNILAPYLFRLILLKLVSEMHFERVICLVGAHLKDDDGIWSIPRRKNGIPENRKRGLSQQNRLY